MFGDAMIASAVRASFEAGSTQRMSVEGLRLWHAILAMIEPDACGVQMAQPQLGQMAGMSGYMVRKHLDELKRLGVLSVHYPLGASPTFYPMTQAEAIAPERYCPEQLLGPDEAPLVARLAAHLMAAEGRSEDQAEAEALRRVAMGDVPELLWENVDE